MTNWGKGAAARLDGRQWILAGAIGLVSIGWLMTLSNWWGVHAGSTMVTRQNVLFDSDMNLWVDRMRGGAKSQEQAVHPLEIQLWSWPCRAVAHFLKPFVGGPEASVLGTRIVVASVVSAGVAALALLGLWLGIPPMQCLALFVIYLLFSSNSTICLPEHFGITNALMTLAFVATVMIFHRWIKLAVLALLAVICGGTSILDIVFPGFCVFVSLFRSLRAKLWALILTVPPGAAALVWIYLHNAQVRWYFDYFATLRWFRHPLRAVVYAIYMFTLPAVGPAPGVMRIPGDDMVSYEPLYKPLELGYYFSLQGIGAAAWLLLFACCAAYAFRDKQLLPYARLLFAWLAFNIVFYNFWGRELMLWAPAWSWALMAVVVLGASKLPWKLLAAAFAPIVVSQVETLFAIKRALSTITQ